VTRVAVLIAVAASAFVAGCFGGDDKKSSSSRSPTATSDGSAATTTADTSVCNYYFEWLDRVRFPLQADPHAAYRYMIPSVSPASDHVAFTVKGPAPNAPWTSWMVYTGKAQPFSLVGKSDIAPDPGNVNPWSGAPTAISALNRDFTLLVLPNGVRASPAARASSWTEAC
jgi:hypothetical protein